MRRGVAHSSHTSLGYRKEQVFVPRGCIIGFSLRPAALAQKPFALSRAGMVPQKRIFF